MYGDGTKEVSAYTDTFARCPVCHTVNDRDGKKCRHFVAIKEQIQRTFVFDLILPEESEDCDNPECKDGKITIYEDGKDQVKYCPKCNGLGIMRSNIVVHEEAA